MKPASSNSPCRGFVLVVLIVLVALVLAFALVMARLTVLEFGRQRQFTLETWVDEAAASAQDWSRMHAAELAGDVPMRLPLDALLPRGVTGEVELQRGTSGDTAVVHCRITLEQGRTRIRREVAWPLTCFPSAGA
jgi:hypothetical protein